MREEEFNQEYLRFAEGKHVKFGTHVHIMHVESGYFFEIMHQNITESSFLLRLSKSPSRSCVFLMESIHKLRSHNSRVQVTDDIIIYHEKSEMYLNIEPIDEGKSNLARFQNKNLKEEKSVYEFDLSSLHQPQKFQVTLRSTESFFRVQCVRKWNTKDSSMIYSNTLVRVNFPSFDAYMCADHVYEVR